MWREGEGAMRFKRNPSGRGGYFEGERFSFAYRGFRIRPFIRLRPIMIGSTRLYTLGPLGLFIKSGRAR